MIDRLILSRFIEQFDGLNVVIQKSAARAISEPPDDLFLDNQNIFVKLYLVSACSILEAFIQDLAMAYVDHIQERINNSNLPFNFVIWLAENEKTRSEFKKFEGKKTKNDIEELISPNYWKTMKAFDRVGIDLSGTEVSVFKDYITITVLKRNRIVHHNDEASDLSFGDISYTVSKFKEYCECLFNAVDANSHLVTTAALAAEASQAEVLDGSAP